MGLIRSLHDAVFGGLERLAGEWFLPLASRFAFLAVLFFYYLNSAMTKVGDGFAGFFQVRSGAYYQILTEKGLEAFGGSVSGVPWYGDLIVYAGTYAEFILPVLIVIGLFTRIAAAGMIVFVLVQSWVDVNFHGIAGDNLGAWFDRDSGALIMDQRLLWIFLLLVLVIRGAGAVSVDRLLSFGRRS